MKRKKREKRDKQTNTPQPKLYLPISCRVCGRSYDDMATGVYVPHRCYETGPTVANAYRSESAFVEALRSAFTPKPYNE